MKRSGTFITGLFIGALLLLCSPVLAGEFSIIYTGNTHASLYPCGRCPASVGGGITRRAAMIKSLRQSGKSSIVLDAGNFVEGSLGDSAAAGEDGTKTGYYMDALAKIDYDGILIGRRDINLRKEIVTGLAGKSVIKFISSNLNIPGVKSFLIKKAGDLRVAVLGHTSGGSYGESAFKDAVTKTLGDIGSGADIFILLTDAGYKEVKQIIEQFPEIDVIVSSGLVENSSPYRVYKDSFILNTLPLRGEVGVAGFRTEDKKIVSMDFSSKRLGLDIEEDQEIRKIIPACFSDGDCDPGGTGKASCVNPGTLSALCKPVQAPPLEITLITDTGCVFCRTAASESFLSGNLRDPGFNKIDYRGREGIELINKYGIKTLPAFLIPRDIEKEKKFLDLSMFLESKNGNYLLKDDLSGVFLFLDREFIRGRVDLFFSLYDGNASKIVEDLLAFEKRNPGLTVFFHPLFSRGKEGFEAENGLAEIEEIERIALIEKYYPDKLKTYLTVRLADKVESSWWPVCLEKSGLDYRDLREKLHTADINAVLEDRQRTQEILGIRDGTVILVANRMIFRIFDVNEGELLSLLEYAGSSEQ